MAMQQAERRAKALRGEVRVQKAINTAKTQVLMLAIAGSMALVLMLGLFSSYSSPTAVVGDAASGEGTRLLETAAAASSNHGPSTGDCDAIDPFAGLPQGEVAQQDFAAGDFSEYEA
jgi:hypothetical protein